MGIRHNPDPVKLFCAIMCAPEFDIKTIQKKLIAKYGPVEFSHGPIPFGFTGYYDEEMGTGLIKSYLVFKQLADRDMLPRVKTWTNKIERELAHEGRRIVNLDPGYLARDKLVLASTKDFYHRLYLDKGIFGEVTLHFRKGVFRFFSWTYQDYQETGFVAMLTKARAKLVGELRKDSDL